MGLTAASPKMCSMMDFYLMFNGVEYTAYKQLT